jgi:hypothetical protein
LAPYSQSLRWGGGSTRRKSPDVLAEPQDKGAESHGKSTLAGQWLVDLKYSQPVQRLANGQNIGFRLPNAGL